MKIEIRKASSEPEGRTLAVGELVVGALSPGGLKFILLRKARTALSSMAIQLHRLDENGLAVIGPADKIKVYDIQPVKTLVAEV